MSVTMSKVDGITVFTLTTDTKSRWPPLCQVLKSLCYSPVCCSVSQHLRRIQRTTLSVLGALQIIIGLLNIGLGVILHLTYSTYSIYGIGLPYWLGALFIVFGITCILSERYPSPCMVIFNVILNLAGEAFAITAIVLYSISVANINLWWYDCDNRSYWSYTTPSPSREDEYFREKCLAAKNLIMMLLRSIYGVLIVLSTLELCVVISSVVLGIKALKSSGKEQNKSSCDPEQFKALLDDVATNSAD
ncbi:transmembrane protein 176B [Nematolebias whitei]|uniref:transmembrane protein 176B n=1 Tax=Nematolebias whitei TaxID=451745 RepID=UPI001896D2E4|nr:transmembrane protein 176B [Nematolebias whitei]